MTLRSGGASAAYARSEESGAAASKLAAAHSWGIVPFTFGFEQ